MSTDKIAKTVQCPICQKSVPWIPSQQYRPFCSERCKLIDLGDWASEGHRITGQPSEPDDY
ncbi:MAG: DNA gyrase inhibitor YacG [Methylococcales bacterium]